MPRTIAPPKLHKLALPAHACRRVAKHCCDQCGLPGVDIATEQRLRRAAALLMRQSDGRRDNERCEIEATLEGFLWLQKRLWKGAAVDATLNFVCREISVQLSSGI